MSVLLKAFLFGIGTGLWGIVLCVSPWGSRLEENLGLNLLFRIRGAVEPPPEVVIIGIDQASARRLKLHHKPQLWPRSLHTQLVRRLEEANAKLIAFDVIFDEPRDAKQDTDFAAAIAEAGNVLLVEVLRKEKLSLEDGSGQLEIERLNQPIAVLRDAALAPFPIPKVPVKVSQYWTFKTGAGSALPSPWLPFRLLPWTPMMS
jgi:adenylate cyclase